MSRTLEEKADAILTEGRLTVDRVSVAPGGRLIIARCVSSGGEKTYALGYDPRNREWRCTCQVYGARCSHLAALRRVVEDPRSVRSE